MLKKAFPDTLLKFFQERCLTASASYEQLHDDALRKLSEDLLKEDFRMKCHLLDELMTYIVLEAVRLAQESSSLQDTMAGILKTALCLVHFALHASLPHA